MKIAYIITFTTLLYVACALRSDLHNRNLVRRGIQGEELFPEVTALCVGDSCKHHRERRSFLSGIIKLAKVAWTGSKITLKVAHHGLLVGSLAWTIIDSASGGCASYPDICNNKDKLRILEEECASRASELMTMYDNVTQDYEILREVVLNNIEIDNILKGIADVVDSVFNMSVEVDSILSKNISNTDILATHTPEEIVNIIVPPVEYRLQNLEQVIKDTQKEGFKSVGEHIAIALGVEAIAAGFSKFYSTYKASAEVAEAGAKFSTKLRMTFSSLFTKTKTFFTNFKTNIKTILSNKLSSFKAKITNPRGTVKSYFKGISAAHTFVNAMGAAAGAVLIYINDKHWNEVDRMMKEGVANYTKYKSELDEQLVLAKSQTETVTDIKIEAIQTFNNIISTLSSGINDTIYNDTELFERLESGVLPSNIANLLNKEMATEDNVKVKQANILKIVNDSKFSLENYKGWVKALNMIVTSAYDGIQSSSAVLDIHSDVTIGFSFQDAVVKQFSSLVSLESLLCVLTYLLPSSASYRTFPLTSIRNECTLQGKFVMSDVYKTEHKNMATEYIIREEVEKQSVARADTSADKCAFTWEPPKCIGSVTVIHTAIDTYYKKDSTLSTFTSPTSKQIVEKIAELFPDESTFAFIDLTQFRNGNEVSDSAFSDMLFDAEYEYYMCKMDEKRKARAECNP